MTDGKGAGEGPYMVVVALDGKGGFQIAGPNGYLSAPRSLSGAQNQLVDMNLAHAEGRKAEESYTAKMLKSATDEVRRCHEEIRRLEDKYARNFYRMPVSLDEESAKKVAQDLKELLEFVNRIMEFFKHYTYCPRCKSDIDHTDECELENAADSVLINFSRKCIDDFYVWKKVRGIE